MYNERAVLFCEWKGHEQARNELGSMLSGYLRTTGLERTLDCQWYAHGIGSPIGSGMTFVIAGMQITVIAGLIGNLRLEGIHYLLRAGQRTSKQSLFAGKFHGLRTDLRHDRDHHSCQQARLPYMKHWGSVLILRRSSVR